MANDLQLFCGGFWVDLSGHHSSADAALFPLVIDAQPDLAPTIAKLIQDTI